MASILDMASQNFMANNQAPDLGGAMLKGAELAQHVQTIQSQRADIENKKQNLELTKWERAGQLGEVYNKMENGPTKQAFGRNIYTPGLQVLLGDQLHPGSKNLAISDPSYLAYSMDEVRAGNRTFAEAKKKASDPELTGEDMASQSFLNYKAQKKIAALPQAQEMQDQLSYQAKNNIVTSIEAGKSGGGMTPAELYKARTDPDVRAAVIKKLGIDKLGGEETFNDVMNAYAKDIETSAKVGLQHDAAYRQAELTQGPRQGQLDTRKTDQADKATADIHKAVKPLTQPALALQKGLHVLNVPNVSWKRLNEVAQDFSKAMTNSAVSSDFKLKQLDTPSAKQALADLVAYADSNPQQPADPKVVSYWMQFGNDLNDVYSRQMSAIAANRGKTAQLVYGKTNPTAVKAVKETVKSYRNGTWSDENATPTYEVNGRRLTEEQIMNLLSINKKFKAKLPANVVEDLGL